MTEKEREAMMVALDALRNADRAIHAARMAIRRELFPYAEDVILERTYKAALTREGSQR